MTTYVDLPEQMRIFELAKRLDVPAAELMGRLNHLDIGARSVLNAIGRDEIRRVLEYYESGDSWRYTSPDPAAVEQMLDAINRETLPGDRTVIEVRESLDEDFDEGTPPATSVTGTELDLTDADPDEPESPTDSEVAEGHDDADPDEPESPTDSEVAEGHDDADPDEPESLTDSEVAGGHDDADPDGPEPSTEFLVTEPVTEPITDEPELPTDFTLSQEDQSDPVEPEVGPETRSGDEPKPQTGLVARIDARWRAMGARQRILSVGAVIVLGTMLVTLLYALVSPTYAAESDVVITINGLGSEVDRELQSFNVVATSQTVLAPVAEEFDMSVPDLRESFGSEIIGDSTVLRLTTTAGSPEEALALNEALVASFLTVANQPLDQDELTFVAERIDLVTAEMAALDSELSELEAEEAANAATRLQVESERDILQAQLADLEGLLVDLRASGSPPAGSVTFVEGRINDAEAQLTELITEAQALESVDAATRSAADRLREERAVLRAELREFQALQVDLELGQIAGNRVAVLAAGHMVDDPVGLTPTRAIVLGLLVGGALAFAWVVAATQLRRQR
jgi:hypothetical protein